MNEPEELPISDGSEHGPFPGGPICSGTMATIRRPI